FSISGLSSFLNHDETAIKATIKTFASDTKDNSILLQNAMKANDTEAINSISHKMLSMYKLLQVHQAILHLEALAHYNTFTEKNFNEVEKSTQQLLEAIDKYLS